MWDLIVSVPDHCLSFYFSFKLFLLVKLILVDFVTFLVICLFVFVSFCFVCLFLFCCRCCCCCLLLLLLLLLF